MDSIKEIEERIDAFNKARDWDQFHSPANLAKSIAIEAGELLECFQWDEKNYSLQDVSEELADVMNYCFQMAMVLGVDPKEIIMKKMDMTEKKYPTNKAKGVSTKYNKL
jgi:NTP pyrophosphatase (non-canonical NTP hydrolase)